MSENFLDDADVRPVSQEKRRHGMSDHVRRHACGDAGRVGAFREKAGHALRRDRCAGRIHQKTLVGQV